MTDIRCGRPKVNGEPCKNHRMSPGVLLWGLSYESPSCTSHATKAERLECAQVAALAEDSWREHARRDWRAFNAGIG